MTVGVVLVFVGLVLAFESGRAHEAEVLAWRSPTRRQRAEQTAAQLDAVAQSAARHPGRLPGVIPEPRS